MKIPQPVALSLENSLALFSESTVNFDQHIAQYGRAIVTRKIYRKSVVAPPITVCSSETMAPYVQVAMALFGPLVGIWLGILLSERKTYRERGWDLKAQAYSSIFEALEKMRRSDKRSLDAELTHRERDEAEEQRDNEAYRATSEALFVLIARESWILPDDVQERLGALDRRLSQHHKSYFDSVEDGHAALTQAAEALRAIARRDMATRRSRWPTLRTTRGRRDTK